MKKGQLSVFVIVGALVVVAFVFIFTTNLQSQQQEVSTVQENLQLSSVQDYMDFCIENLMHVSFSETLRHGGHYHFDSTPNIEYFSSIPLYTNQQDIPSFSVLEDSMEAYALGYFEPCFADASEEFLTRYTIDESTDPQVNVKILNERIIMEVNYPVSVSEQDGSSYTLSDFRYEWDVDMPTYTNIVGEFIVLLNSYPNGVPLSQIDLFNSEHNIRSSSQFFEEEYVIYALQFDINDVTYYYLFAYQITWGEFL